MADLVIRQFIRAAPQRVWDVISDLQGQERWMVDVRKLEITSETKSGAGATIELTSELFGLPLVHDIMDVVTWREPYEISIVHRGAFTGTASFLLAAAPGGTIFTWKEQFVPPMGPLGELAFRFVVHDHLVRVFSRSMENVRRLAEGNG